MLDLLARYKEIGFNHLECQSAHPTRKTRTRIPSPGSNEKISLKSKLESKLPTIPNMHHGHVRDKQDHIAQIHPEMLCKRPHPLILEQKPGYQQWIAEDPLEFLNQIEQACISYQENDYPSAAYWKVIERTITLKQGPNKTCMLPDLKINGRYSTCQSIGSLLVSKRRMRRKRILF
jgi:hypothetical protein